jgi:hypothetical protein
MVLTPLTQDSTTKWEDLCRIMDERTQLQSLQKKYEWIWRILGVWTLNDGRPDWKGKEESEMKWWNV